MRWYDDSWGGEGKVVEMMGTFTGLSWGGWYTTQDERHTHITIKQAHFIPEKEYFIPIPIYTTNTQKTLSTKTPHLSIILFKETQSRAFKRKWKNPRAVTASSPA